MDKMIEDKRGMKAVFHEYFGNALEDVAYERAVGFDEWVKAHGDEGKEFLECYEAQYWGADELAECTLPVTRTPKSPRIYTASSALRSPYAFSITRRLCPFFTGGSANVLIERST